MTNAQNAEPIPRIVTPEAAIRKVRTAASRSLSLRSELASEDASVARRASPATVSTVPSGAAATSVASAADASASTKYAHPAVNAAVHRLFGSGCAEGAAARAALMAARLIAWPPAGAPTIVPSAVTVIEDRHGTT